MHALFHTATLETVRNKNLSKNPFSTWGFVFISIKKKCTFPFAWDKQDNSTFYFRLSLLNLCKSYVSYGNEYYLIIRILKKNPV